MSSLGDHPSLRGAVIGPWQVVDRIKPGKRVYYLCLNTETGELKRYRGYELVRMAKQADKEVSMPSYPWKANPA